MSFETGSTSCAHYRILYFIAGRNIVVVSHGVKKEGSVPAVEIERAIARKKKFEANPADYTYRPEKQL